MDWINEEGGFVPDAADMPESVKTLVSSKGYKGVEDIAVAYTNATSKLGVDPDRLVALPKDNDADAWGNVYSKLGRPESPDGYKPTVTPHEGQELNDELVKRFGTIAHEAGLNDAQVSKIMQFQLDLSDEYTTQSAAEAAKAEEIAAADSKNAQDAAWEALKVANSVKTDDDLKALTAGAKEAAQKLGLYDILEAKGLGDDVEIIGKLIEVNRKLSDQMTPDANTVVDMRSYDEKLAAIQSNPAYLDNMHHDHDKIMREYNSLFGINS